MEEAFWQQKLGYNWFKNGDRNTRFFHSVVKGRRQRLQVNRIQDSRRKWLENQEDIVTAAVVFYQDQFTQKRCATDFALLNHVPELIDEDENVELCKIPDHEETKNVVFSLNRDSSGGPDGLSGKFFQTYWDIVGLLRLKISGHDGTYYHPTSKRA